MTDIGGDNSQLTDSGAGRGRARIILRVAADVFGIVQLLFGGLGFFGIYQWLTAPKDNPERYELLFVPIAAFLCSVPLLAVCAYAYRKCNSEFVPLEKWIINVGCTLPILGVVIVVCLECSQSLG